MTVHNDYQDLRIEHEQQPFLHRGGSLGLGVHGRQIQRKQTGDTLFFEELGFASRDISLCGIGGHVTPPADGSSVYDKREINREI